MASKKEKDIDRLQFKLSAYFGHIQSIYDSMHNLDFNNPEQVESFLASSFTIDNIHDRYIETLEMKCNCEIALEESAAKSASSYQSLMAFEQLYTKIKFKINQLSNKQCPGNSLDNDKHSLKHIRLPKLELCSFSGDQENWPIFYETFRTAVHENPGLSDGEKIIYLMGKLTGNALTICQGILPSAENYMVIWKALLSRYNDRRLMAANYLDRLMNLPAIDNTPASLESFIDKFSSIISALHQLKITSLEDLLFIHIGCKKINLETVKAFEMSLNDADKIPTCDEFVEFVRKHAHLLKRAHNVTDNNMKSTQSRKNVLSTNTSQTSNRSPGLRSNTNVKTFVNVQEHSNCVCCDKSDHPLTKCPTFLATSPRDRFAIIKRNNLCVNCFDKHTLPNCPSNSRCKLCARSHNDLLHFGNSGTTSNRYVIASQNNGNRSTALITNVNKQTMRSATADERSLAARPIGPNNDGHNGQSDTDRPVTLCAVGIKCAAVSGTDDIKSGTSVLLGTAQCHVVDEMGNIHLVRAIIDSASQRDFITTECCQRLNLPLYPTASKYVSGVGDVTNPIEGITCLTLRSRHTDEVKFTIQPLVVSRITDTLPVSSIDTTQLDYLQGLPLADSRFSSPSAVDLILGSDLFARILRPNRVSRNAGEPVGIETLLGYLIVGQAPVLNAKCNVVRAYCTIDESLNNHVSRFFELEEVPSIENMFSPDEQKCEEFYTSTTRRDDTGRFVVSLPFKKDAACLGNSVQAAERRYLSLERKLLADPSIKKEYDNVFREYLDKGYLRAIDNAASESDEPHYVIPHHGVVRTDKSTSRLRVVLDASSATSNGMSLNDILYTGPNLQNDLFQILLRFRLLPIAISADIRQMYLRILMSDDNWRFQRLLYRFDPNDPIQTFEMTRVPFGLCCSPFLAVRSVRQLAIDERAHYPAASRVAEKEIYMDDLATSCLSNTDGIELSDQLIKMFATAGFDLVKFSSNSTEVMESIPIDHRVSEAVEFSPADQLKILGLHWLPAEDVFTFSVNIEPRTCTKRNILSRIARLWDLLGFIAPVTLLAKLVVKSLWDQNVDWDETPNTNIIKLWQSFESELPLLQNVKLPRHVGVTDDCVISLLGFADASEAAYGGVVYIHVYFPRLDKTVVNLVCAKSRVAPSKTLVTVARLELCANLVLAKLMRVVIDTYSLPACSVYAFTDSKVALAWIHATPSRWQTFVANRVSQIQKKLDPSVFHHIAGQDNPADCLSRGLTPAQLIVHPLWFNGPRFAYQPRSEWPLNNDFGTSDEIPEAKVSVMATTDSSAPPLTPLCELANRVSTWTRLLRIVIFVLRFVKKLPTKFDISHLEIAEFAIIKDLQRVYFANEIAKCKAGKQLPPAFRKLNAFVDENDILRVGGRLTNAEIAYDSRHPILLPRRDHIVNLIIEYHHRKNLHTGPQLLMSILRQKYWIMSARNIVRNRVQKCNICFRTRPTNQFPIMASLPACRVNEAKAFCHTGVDYCGPLSIVIHRGRGVRSVRSYICLFVCLVTKSVHLELSPYLSTESFLNALRRFLARRGPISTIYSDRGTNFVGAKSYLDNMYELLDSEEYRDKFANELRDKRIQFSFNPAASPHMGGIWEANVRSVKTILAKVVGTQLLTYEEMLTVLTQIEALLNSRPLSVLSSDPAEPLALTPAHFLVFTPLKSLPSEDLANVNFNLLHRKRVIDHLIQSFWKRWKVEYLNTLQVRNKWTKHTASIQKGAVVLLESENSAPLDWPIGVIERTFEGKDSVVRVVDVRTRSGIYRRPVVKVYPLPTQ